MTLYLLHLHCNVPLAKRFFWLIFDMMGPMWTPLPKSYHLSYWEAFGTIPRHELDFPLDHISIAHFAAKRLIKHQHRWINDIGTIIGVEPCLTKAHTSTSPSH